MTDKKAKVVQSLEETLLIGWLKKNYTGIEFIAKKLDYEAHDRTKKLVEAIQNLDEDKNFAIRIAKN